ncbi:MAG: SRPBCC domain-containing protein [Pseudomonadota bacterium]
MTIPTGTFTIERRIACTPDRLWHLLIDPEARSAWGSPSDDAVLVLDRHDTREGGQDRHFCGPKEAPEFLVDTHWYHLSLHELACFTETLEIGGHRITVSLVTYALAPADGATDLTVNVAVSSLGDEDGTEDHKAGWTSALDRLVRQVNDMPADA